MPAVPTEKVHKNQGHPPLLVKPSKNLAIEPPASIARRSALFATSPTTQDLLDAINNSHTVLIEGNTLKSGLAGFEAPPGELAISLTTLTAYIIDIVAVIDHFLLYKTSLHPVLCEQVLTSTHEVITNTILWDNLEVDCPQSRQKTLNFGDLIKQRLGNKILAQRPLKVNFHLKPEWIDVVVIGSGKGFDWAKAVSNISSDVQGLAIIRSFADEVTVEDNGKITRLRFYT